MIDLGTTLVAPTPTTLGLDEICTAAIHYDLPVVLDVQPGEEQGPVPDDPVIARRLSLLARPEWILAVRRHTGTQTQRLCIAGTADAAVVATRGPDAVVLFDLAGDVAAPVASALGPSPALQFDACNIPTHELAAVLDPPLSVAAAVRRLTAQGAPEHSAETIGTALRKHPTHTQIVGISCGDGNRTQFDEHLTVFDAAGGRILVTSTLAADGVRWSSLSPGTAPRIAHAVRSLVDGTRRFSRSGCPARG